MDYLSSAVRSGLLQQVPSEGAGEAAEGLGQAGAEEQKVGAGSSAPAAAVALAVVCAGGVRSAQATVRLSKVFGFRGVASVRGGMAAWAAEGLPMQAEA